MFRSCPNCKGWGVAPDKLFFNIEKCPQCHGCRIVDEETYRPFGYEETDIEKEEKKNNKPLWRRL